MLVQKRQKACLKSEKNEKSTDTDLERVAPVDDGARAHREAADAPQSTLALQLRRRCRHRAGVVVDDSRLRAFRARRPSPRRPRRDVLLLLLMMMMMLAPHHQASSIRLGNRSDASTRSTFCVAETKAQTSV